MVLGSLLGQGDADFAASPALERAVLIGARAFDDVEREAVDSGLVGLVPGDPVAVRGAFEGAQCVYLHVDLDVLDPAEFDGLNYPEPGGLTVAQLVDAISALGEFDVIGAGVTECVGTGPELRVLEPVLAAIGALLA